MDIIVRCTHKEKKMKQYIFKVSFQISPRISLSFIYSFIYLIYLFIHLFILLFLKNKKNIFTSHIKNNNRLLDYSKNKKITVKYNKHKLKSVHIFCIVNILFA